MIITDVQPKTDRDGTVKKTNNGDVKYKVSVQGIDRNFTAYGDWVKDYVGKETEFETKDDEYMGHEFTIIWEPKLGQATPAEVAKVVADKTHAEITEEMGKKFDQATQQSAEDAKWDKIARGKVLSNLVTAYVTYSGDLDPDADVWELLKLLRDRIMKG